MVSVVDKSSVTRIVEMGLLCAGRPCSESHLLKLFSKEESVSKSQLLESLEELSGVWGDRGLELHRSAGGWHLRSREDHKIRLSKFLEAAPPRLSRPMTEVLAIVAYHQPVTRGDVEKLRGVSTSANQLAHLEELGWVEVVGKRESPGRPLEYGTTTRFLDDLGVKDVSDLPDLEEFEREIGEEQEGTNENGKDVAPKGAENKG